MNEPWPDIPGVTERAGRPLLPTDPEEVARTLAVALEGGTLAEIGARALRGTAQDPARVAGLVGWLPVSRVAWLDAEGALRFVPGAHLADLALRFAAWIGVQPVVRADSESLVRYAQGVMESAARFGDRRPTAVAARPAPSPVPAEATPETPAASDLRARLEALLPALDAAFLERGPQLRLALLSLLSGQHALLLGPPGTAKSMLARALCDCFDGAVYFEYLLSRFTHPDELFGPVSIPGLKEEDYRRLTEGFLPSAHVAFLDEVFKANSAILNSLLTLVNERVFHHGRHRDPVPLIGLVGASNELPDAGAGLDALYDRFLVRLSVPPLGDAEHFLAVATGAVPAPKLPSDARLRLDDLHALAEAAAAVEVPPSIREDLVALWQAASRGDWGVSDRRWRAAIRLLQTAAAAEGRDRLDRLDLLLLEPILAASPEQAGAAREAILGRLGERAVPQHDLRAQWTLLRGDRVAPPPGQGLPEPLPHGADWRARLARRHQGATWVLAHHAEAVDALAADRERIEAQTAGHLWLQRLPPGLLGAHITAGRDLAAILELAERYARATQSPVEAAKWLLRHVPVTRRVYGASAVVVLDLTDAKLTVPLTLAGEKVAANQADTPRVALTAEQLLDWVARAPASKDLLAGLPAAAARDAHGALDALRRPFEGDPVPLPPELPAP